MANQLDKTNNPNQELFEKSISIVIIKTKRMSQAETITNKSDALI